MPHLLFYRDGREVLRFPLSADEVTLGRHSQNDVSLPDPQVSRFHARLVRQGPNYQLENISRVGTQVGGQLVEKVLLSNQDVFQIGPWRIIYEVTSHLDEDETAISSQLSSDNGTLFCGMVGQSDSMKRVFDLIKKGASSFLPVMIQGETGTGKELVARALHTLSGRQGSFVALNCGAISPHLIESEIFGHERGAFTGAITQHKGAFEQACGGTLFLDEIGELPIELQPKLLRVIEESTFKRVGGLNEIQADIRIVSATHRNLKDEVQEKRFRQDLYYRLMGLPIYISPLRERTEDIPFLARHFVVSASPSKLSRDLSESAIERLNSYPWYGNVRELKNVLARSLLFCSEAVLTESDIKFLETSSDQDDVSLEGIEKEAVQSALKASGGNKRLAAERLGVAKSTLFRKIKEFGLGD